MENKERHVTLRRSCTGASPARPSRNLQLQAILPINETESARTEIPILPSLSSSVSYLATLRAGKDLSSSLSSKSPQYSRREQQETRKKRKKTRKTCGSSFNNDDFNWNKDPVMGCLHHDELSAVRPGNGNHKARRTISSKVSQETESRHYQNLSLARQQM